MLQDSYENLKGLIIVPGAEYSLHKKNLLLFSKISALGIYYQKKPGPGTLRYITHSLTFNFYLHKQTYIT